jgi:DNA-binding FadR family transcriptional regulator
MPGIDEIYRRMLTAIVENRLRPGMQLVEERLATIFGVSRTKIREATASGRARRRRPARHRAVVGRVPSADG